MSFSLFPCAHQLAIDPYTVQRIIIDSNTGALFQLALSISTSQVQGSVNYLMNDCKSRMATIMDHIATVKTKIRKHKEVSPWMKTYGDTSRETAGNLKRDCRKIERK